MSPKHRTRAEWKRLVREAKRGSIAETAARHGVKPKTLAWWRWMLRAERPTPKRPKKRPRMVPVVVGGPTEIAALANNAQVEIELGGLSMRVPIGSEVNYVAALVAAVRSTC